MKWQHFIYALAITAAGTGAGNAQEPAVVTLNLVPIQAAYVKGDVAKFRAINWTKDGVQSGIGDATLNAKVGKDVTVSFEGSGMYGDSDYNGEMLITKENVGYIKLNYDSFRKYYENRGGYFPSFTQTSLADHQKLQLITLDQDLALDIGHFGFEMGRGTPEDSSLSIGYDRNTKDGSKDKLTWGYAKDTVFGASTGQQRLLTPTYADINDVTDTITLKGKTKVAGFTIKGEQKVVFYDGNQIETAQPQSNSATVADNEIVRRNLNPDSKEFMSTVRAERWTLNDKSYLALGYRYAHLNTNAYQTMDQFNGLTGANLNTNSRYIWTKGKQDSNIWTGELLSNLTDKLVAISRVKTELKTIRTDSDFDNSATTAVLPVQNYNNASEINTAESVSLRYAALPKTSLYADFDLSQERYNRDLFTAADLSQLQTLNHVGEGSGTLGVRFSPVKTVNVTAEYQHSSKDDKTERFLNTVNLSNDGAAGIFRTDKDQIMSRISWKPLKWLQNSFKVIQAQNVYHTQVLVYDMTKTPGSERDFVYDVALMPSDQWMFNLSYSAKYLKVEGRGIQNSYIPPASTSNVYSYALTSSYAPTEKLSLFNTLSYNRARNLANDASTTFLSTSTSPLYWGPNDMWWDIDTGAKWEVKKNVTIEPHYAYYSYRAYPGIETGNYSANVFWLDVNTKW